MPLYQYLSVSEKGRTLRGTIDADSLPEARQKLIQRQIAVISLDLLPLKKTKSPIKKGELLTFTKEMTRLLHAGLPLYETLSALEEKYRGQKIHTLLLDLTDKIRSGHSFSSSLAQHEETFDLLYVSMISNAEKMGRLTQTLEEMALLITKQMQMKKQLITAFLYPGLLASFCLIVLSSLLFFVVPSLKELFEGRELHPFTQIVFAISGWACNAKLFLSFLFLAFLGGLFFLFFTPQGKRYSLSFISHLPWLKSLFAKLALVRFCRASSALIDGGLPAVAAFAQAKAVMRHPPLERVISLAEQKMTQGEPLHLAFQNHSLIPPLVPRMIAIAQQGGKLSFMMQQIAQIYEEELETLLAYFAAMAQPILLLILGGIVGFVLLSVLLPLTDVSSFVT